MDFQLHASRSGAFDFGKVTSNFTSNTYIEGGGHRFLSFNEYYTIALTARLDWGVPVVPLSTRYCYH